MSEEFKLDEVDRAIIAATDKGLPLTPRPYLEIAIATATDYGVSEEEVIARMEDMLAAGVIRRIGVVPNHYRLGVSANGMTVWDVDDAAAEELGPKIGALPFVTHCYLRPRKLPEWPYNLFAMAHGSSRDEVREKAAEIAALIGPALRGSDILFSTRILKKTGMRLATRRRTSCSA